MHRASGIITNDTSLVALSTPLGLLFVTTLSKTSRARKDLPKKAGDRSLYKSRFVGLDPTIPSLKLQQAAMQLFHSCQPRHIFPCPDVDGPCDALAVGPTGLR